MRIVDPAMVLSIILAMHGCSDDSVGTGGAGGDNSGGTGGSEQGGSAMGGAPATGKRVFITSEAYTGDLGGLAGADDKCESLAAGARLGGTWLAWLSETPFSGNPDPAGPLTRFTPSTAPYVLVGGAQIAPDFAGLIDGSLDAPIDHDETGAPIGDVTPSAWTGTSETGMPVSPCCGDWLATDTGSGFGLATATDSNWSFGGGQGCTEMARLYCFEQ